MGEHGGQREAVGQSVGGGEGGSMAAGASGGKAEVVLLSRTTSPPPPPFGRLGSLVRQCVDRRQLFGSREVGPKKKLAKKLLSRCTMACRILEPK